jgi:hypothetical protein
MCWRVCAKAQKDAYLTKFESVTVNKDLNSEVVFELSTAVLMLHQQYRLQLHH